MNVILVLSESECEGADAVLQCILLLCQFSYFAYHIKMCSHELDSKPVSVHMVRHFSACLSFDPDHTYKQAKNAHRG